MLAIGRVKAVNSASPELGNRDSSCLLLSDSDNLSLDKRDCRDKFGEKVWCYRENADVSYRFRAEEITEDWESRHARPPTARSRWTQRDRRIRDRSQRAS